MVSLMRRKNFQLLTAGLLLLLFSAFSSSAFAESLPEEVPLVMAQGKGLGASRDEALRLAWKDAVRKALGMVIDSKTSREGERLQESITLLSRGYIEKYEILQEKQENGIFTVAIQAWIRGETLLQGLLSDRPGEYSLDGKSLYASAFSREKQFREAREILFEWMTSFAYENYLDVSVAEPLFSYEKGEVSLKVTLTFDTLRYYRDFAGEMARILDYVALEKGKEFPMLLKRDSKTGNVELPFERKTLEEYVKLFGVDLSGKNRERRDFLISGEKARANVYLGTGAFYFSAYALPEEVFRSLWQELWNPEKIRAPRGNFFKRGSLQITLKNEAGIDLLTHRENLNVQNVILFPHPQAPLFEKNKTPENQALFLLPSFGNPGGESRGDYCLYPKEEKRIVLKVEPDIMRVVTGASCVIQLER